jgi:hypothetical protein
MLAHCKQMMDAYRSKAKYCSSYGLALSLSGGRPTDEGKNCAINGEGVCHTNVVRNYMIISAFGLVLLFASNQAIVLVAALYPPLDWLPYLL